MAYYSNSGAQIYSGAAGLLQSYKDGVLGAMSTMVDGSQPMTSGARTISIYSAYTARQPVRSLYNQTPRKRLPPGTQMWKIQFRIDNAKPDSITKVNSAIRADGGVLIGYKHPTRDTFGSGYGTMYYPKNIYGTKFYNGVPVVIFGSVRATTSDRLASLHGVGAAPLQSYHDGSLGAAPLQSYHDGVLGGLGGSLQAFQDGSLGMFDSGPLMSYQDGSLGQAAENPTSIMQAAAGEYFTATGEYFNGTSGCSSCGLGQAATTLPLLNLSDPQVMKELKTAMLVAPWILVNLQNAADQVEADALDPNWTPFTTKIAEGWMQGYGPWMVAKLGGQTQGATAEEYTVAAQNGFVPPEQIPNALGVQAIFSVLEVIFLGEDGQGKNALMTPEQFPNLIAFVGAVRANNGEGEVAFTHKGLFGQASAVQIGLGAVVIGSLLYLAFGKKRRK